MGVNKHASSIQKFKENTILMVALRHVLEVLCFMKQYKGNLKQNLVIHNHNMRSKRDLHTYFCNTALFQKSVLHTGIKLYKNLPLKTKTLDNGNCVKKEVKIVFLISSFYTIEEFLQLKSL
jgi:hypothetical protein